MERHGVAELAREASPDRGGAVPAAEAAAMLGVAVGQIEAVAAEYPGMGNWGVKSGRLVSIPRDQLGLFARALGRPAERAVMAWPAA